MPKTLNLDLRPLINFGVNKAVKANKNSVPQIPRKVQKTLNNVNQGISLVKAMLPHEISKNIPNVPVNLSSGTIVRTATNLVKGVLSGLVKPKSVISQGKINLGASLTKVSSSVFKATTGSSLSYNFVDPEALLRETGGAYVCGYKFDVGVDQVPLQQQVIVENRIQDKVTLVIYALLQEDFSFGTNCHFKPILPSIPFVSNAINSGADISQLISSVGSSGISVKNSGLFTRRMWDGSDPIRMSLRLKFMAISEGAEAKREVVDPCLELACLALPKKVGEFMFAPGPSPLSLGGNTTETGWGESTTISIGTLVTFQRVVITNVSDIRFSNKMNNQGIPMDSEAVVTFETFEVFTKEDLKYAFHRELKKE